MNSPVTAFNRRGPGRANKDFDMRADLGCPRPTVDEAITRITGAVTSSL
ncbi:hypothetical protein [Microvirga vignae]|nr:hypothetical protein [Microvirga vignae]